MDATTAHVKKGGSTVLKIHVQWMEAGVSGQTGLPAPEHVGRSQCPATGAVGVQNLKREGLTVSENRKYTTEWESKFRDNLVQSSPSVLSMVRGVPGQPGQSVMPVRAPPLGLGSVTAPPPGSEVNPVWERADRLAAVMTTPLSVQTVEVVRWTGPVVNLAPALAQTSMETPSAWTPMGAA